MKAIALCLSLAVLTPLGALADDFDFVVESSPLIFRGTVVRQSASTLRDLKPTPLTIEVKIDDVLRSMPILGNLKNKHVTVLKKQSWVAQTRKQYLFFTTSWIYGESLALREVGHIDAGKIPADARRRIPRALAKAEDQKLKKRLESADLAIVGKVSEIRPAPETWRPEARTPYSPDWWQAQVQIESVEKGHINETSVQVLFPSAPSWNKFPKFDEGQEGIWFLRKENFKNHPTGGNFTALDAYDFRDKSELDRIRRLSTK